MNLNSNNTSITGVFMDEDTAKTVLTFAALGVVAIAYVGYKTGKYIESKIVERFAKNQN